MENVTYPNMFVCFLKFLFGQLIATFHEKRLTGSNKDIFVCLFVCFTLKRKSWVTVTDLLFLKALECGHLKVGYS